MTKILQEKTTNAPRIPYEDIIFDGREGLVYIDGDQPFNLQPAFLYIEEQGASYILSSALTHLLRVDEEYFFGSIDVFLVNNFGAKNRFDDYLFVRVPSEVYSKARIHLCHKLFLLLLPSILGASYRKPLEDILTALLCYEDIHRRADNERTGGVTVEETIEESIDEEAMDTIKARADAEGGVYSSALLAEVFATPQPLTADKDAKIYEAINRKAEGGYIDAISFENKLRMFAERGRVDLLMDEVAEALK